MDKIITLDGKEYKLVEVGKEEKIENFETGDTLFYISIYGEVMSTIFEDTAVDRKLVVFWNAFRTKKLAQKELNTRFAIVRVKKYIAENFGVWELTDEEWEDGDIDKHYICFDYSDKSLVINCFWRHKSYSPIWYLENKAICSDVIANCKEDLEIIFK